MRQIALQAVLPAVLLSSVSVPARADARAGVQTRRYDGYGDPAGEK